MFVIKYDFVLTEDITLGSGCVLEFDGGSISGEHTITGNNTGIQAGLVKIFNTDVTFAGSWDVDVLNIKWFGAKGDGATDDTVAFKNCIESPAVANGGYKVLINKGTYVISNTIYIPHRGINLFGETREQLYYDETFSSCIKFLAENKTLFRIKGNTTNITFEKLSFRSFYSDGIDYKDNIAIKAMPEAPTDDSSKNIVIRDCDFLGFGYHLYVSGITGKIDWQCDHEVIQNCGFSYYAKAGIYVNTRNGFDYALVQSCTFAGYPIENNRPAYGIELDRCGWFKVEACSGTVITANVDEGSDAKTLSSFCNISDASIVGEIIFDEVQMEQQPRWMTIYNVSGGDKKLTFNSCVFDEIIHVDGRCKLHFNDCVFNKNVVVDGDDVYLYNVPCDKISCSGVLYNAYCINNPDVAQISYYGIETLYISDVLKASAENDRPIDQIVNPHMKRYDILATDTMVKWICVNKITNWSSTRAYKLKLFGKYSVGQDGYINVKIHYNSIAAETTLGSLTNADTDDGYFYKEYCFGLNNYDPNMVENYVYLDLNNVTGNITGIVELI